MVSGGRGVVGKVETRGCREDLPKENSAFGASAAAPMCFQSPEEVVKQVVPVDGVAPRAGATCAFGGGFAGCAERRPSPAFSTFFHSLPNEESERVLPQVRAQRRGGKPSWAGACGGVRSAGFSRVCESVQKKCANRANSFDTLGAERHNSPRMNQKALRNSPNSGGNPAPKTALFPCLALASEAPLHGPVI